VGWLVDEPAQQLRHDEAFGPLLADNSALIRRTLCNNV
jgi:hypothetical protein